MLVPEIVNKETVYYTITVFEDPKEYGKTLKCCYSSLSKAIEQFTEIIKLHFYSVVNVRKETVFKRDSNNEFSTSSVIAKYEERKDKP